MNEAIKWFAKEEDKKKAFYLLAGISELGNALDVLCFTPLRDIQVFANKTFKSISGTQHPIISGILLGTSIVTCLPYLAKIFNKNKAESLQDVLEHCDKELGTTYLTSGASLSDADKTKIENFFSAHLKNKENTFVEARVVEKTKGVFRKKKFYDIRYQFTDGLSKLLKGEGSISLETLEKDTSISDSEKAFLRKILVEGKTLAQSRDLFFKRFEKISATDIAKATADGAADVSFQYWLVFFVFDMFYNNADSTAWNLKAQFIALGAALGITLLKFGTKIFHYLKSKWKSKKIDDTFSQESQNENQAKIEIRYADKDLKHAQLTAFYSEQLKENNEKKLEKEWGKYKVSTETKVNLDEILKKELPEKNWRKKFKNRFFSTVKSVEEHENIILGETRSSKSFSQKMIPVNMVVSTGIVAAFINWVAGAAVNAFFQVKTGSLAVSNFLDGLPGGILGVLTFLLGMAFGFGYYKKQKSKLDQAKEELRDKFENNRNKINLLQKFEFENQRMRKFLKENKVERLPTLKPSDDRAFRRLSTEKTKAFTLFKKSVNRATTFIGKMGSGILLFRFLPLAIAACVGISLTAAVSAIVWPLVVVALVFGLIWGGIYLYQYVEERRIASSKTFLAELDLRMEVAKNHNTELRKQLRQEEQPPSNPTADAKNPAQTGVAPQQPVSPPPEAGQGARRSSQRETTAEDLIQSGMFRAEKNGSLDTHQPSADSSKNQGPSL